MSKCWLLTSPHRQLTRVEQDWIGNPPAMLYDYCIASEGDIDDGSIHTHLALRWEVEVDALYLSRNWPGWHIDVLEEHEWDRTVDYTKKDGNYYHRRECIPKPYDDPAPTWRKWQRAVLDAVAKNEPRKVICVVDERGGAGKTYLAMWHAVRHLAIYVPCMHYQDIMRMAYANRVPRWYIYDIPRALTRKQMSQVYSSAETLRDGYCYDDRYEWRSRIQESRPVVIYTNVMPDPKQLSSDRWTYIYPETYY